MDLWDVAKVMWRRRWVAVPLLLLSAVAAVFALLTVPPDYTGTAKIACLPPTVPVDTTQPNQPGNQFTVDTMCEWQMINASRPDVRHQLFNEGLSHDYEVTMKTYGLALMEVVAQAKSRELVTQTLNRLIAMINADVQKLQSHLKPGQSITMQVLDAGEEITVVRTVGKRTLIVIVGVGFLVTVGVSLWVDALVRRRHMRIRDKSESRAAVPVSPAVGMAAAGPPRFIYTEPVDRVTEPLDNYTTDNDSTVVLPLAGVAWSSTKGGKGGPGKGNSGGNAKPR